MPTDDEDQREPLFSMSDGEVMAWIDGGLHLKAITSFGDPVELGTEELRALIAGLAGLLEKLDR